ncbi:hypothetical protein F8388_014997 [Cannabis sativa]|uniref:Uncharacterized protein n=1 Tax=Cannabis sativa TaxID=3483 RepID=A0A7J6DWU3_CANSA|nr:hypothetical protein F8388_014997 [Cannabis sativa]KAF4371346.1 hypothetical protein G4B88_003816 [Cannabis sativa]
MASPVGSFFRCHFSTVEPSNTNTNTNTNTSTTPPLLPLRLRFQNPSKDKDSSFILSSSSSSYGYGDVGGGVSIQMAKRLKLQPKPELGLLSLLFVLSMAFGAIISLVAVSIPTLNEFRRLATSIHQLSNVISEEVPGTLISLKLSGLQIHQLTQQLRNLRQKISPSEKKTSKSSKSRATSFGKKQDGSGFSQNKFSQVSTLQVVDTELNSSYPFVTRSHVGSHASQVGMEEVGCGRWERKEVKMKVSSSKWHCIFEFETLSKNSLRVSYSL